MLPQLNNHVSKLSKRFGMKDVVVVDYDIDTERGFSMAAIIGKIKPKENWVTIKVPVIGYSKKGPDDEMDELRGVEIAISDAMRRASGKTRRK